MESHQNNDKSQGRENFEDFFAHSLSGHVIADAEGKILRINQRLADWLGCDPPGDCRAKILRSLDRWREDLL